MKQNTKWMSKYHKRFAAGLMAATAIAVTGVCAAGPIAGSQSVNADDFSQRPVASGIGGDTSCTQGLEWSSEGSSENFVCRSPESAPAAAQRTMEVTAAGHGIGNAVATPDRFGTDKPASGIKEGRYPTGVEPDDNTRQKTLTYGQKVRAAPSQCPVQQFDKQNSRPHA